MKKKVIKINRAKWRTGHDGKYSTGFGATSLHNNNGFKCCLGFVCCQVTKKACRNGSVPNELERNILGLTFYKKDSWYNTDLARKAISINDNERTKPETKEHQLLKLFKNSPYKLEFYGKYN